MKGCLGIFPWNLFEVIHLPSNNLLFLQFKMFQLHSETIKNMICKWIKCNLGQLTLQAGRCPSQVYF